MQSSDKQPMKLYHIPGTCSLAVEAVLRIAGIPHETVNLALFEVSEAHRAVSPLGKVPALDTGDQALVEGAAINLWLSARHPETGLMPDLASDAGAQALRWLIFSYATVHPAWSRIFMPSRFVTDPAHEAGVRTKAEADLHTYFGLIAAEVRDGGFVAGPELTLADLYLGVCLHWEIHLERKLTAAFPALAAYLDRLTSDPRLAALYGAEFDAAA